MSSNIGTRTKRSPSKDSDAANVNRTPLSQAFREIVFKNGANNRQSNGKSPISPSRVTRLQEKEEMQNLNDRLVIYIDNVRRLESENSRLQALVNTYSESSTRDVHEIKSLYERELDDAKRLIDDLAKEKAKLEIDVNKYKSDAEEATLKLNRREKENKKMETELKSIESEAQAYKARYETVQTDNTRKSEELSHLKPHVIELEKQLAKLKKQLDEETMLRVDSENKLQVLKQDLQFKTQLFDKEVDQVRSSKRIEIEQVDVKLRDEYDSRLLAELQRIRDETENKIQEMKDEVERRYQNKLAEYQSNAKRELQASFVLREEIATCKAKIEELLADIKSHQTKLASNDLKIRDLEEKLRKANVKYETDIGVRDSEITGMRKEIQDLLLEYQELYDIKIALDMEIGAYRKLLESEEQRLNISTHGASHAQLQILGDSYLDEKNQSRTGKKRRMNTQLNQTDQDEHGTSMPGTPLKNSTTIQKDAKIDSSFSKRTVVATTTTNTSSSNPNETVNNNKTKSTSKLFSFW